MIQWQKANKVNMLLSIVYMPQSVTHQSSIVNSIQHMIIQYNTSKAEKTYLLVSTSNRPNIKMK